MCCIVANSIGLNLSGPQSIEKAERKETPKNGACSSVMRMENSRRRRAFTDASEPPCNIRQCFIPGNWLELPLPFCTNTFQRLPQTNLLISPRAVVGESAFRAKPALRQFVICVTHKLS